MHFWSWILVCNSARAHTHTVIQQSSTGSVNLCWAQQSVCLNPNTAARLVHADVCSYEPSCIISPHLAAPQRTAFLFQSVTGFWPPEDQWHTFRCSRWLWFKFTQNKGFCAEYSLALMQVNSSPRAKKVRGVSTSPSCSCDHITSVQRWMRERVFSMDGCITSIDLFSYGLGGHGWKEGSGTETRLQMPSTGYLKKKKRCIPVSVITL